MTLGPIEPSMTGNPNDFPVALSVNVTVPAGAMTLVLLPSIDAPLWFRPGIAPTGDVAGSGAENRPPGPDYQTPFGFCNAISQMREIPDICREPEGGKFSGHSGLAAARRSGMTGYETF